MKQDLCIGDGRGTEGKNWNQGNVLVGVYTTQVLQTNPVLLEGAIFLPIHLGEAGRCHSMRRVPRVTGVVQEMVLNDAWTQRQCL